MTGTSLRSTFVSAALTALVSALGGCGAAASDPPVAARTATTSRTTTAAARARAPFAVGERTVTFVDHSRTVTYPGRRPQPRRLVTIIRYPRAPGPFPLVVFGHGFAVTPVIYGRLLRAWAQAGYIVAAPYFPLENADAPGGPDEADLINQPRDMSFLITRLLASDPQIEPDEIAVAGQSDGGETALAVAYDRFYRDRRVKAAVILSGAELPGAGGFTFPSGSPPLLATQGTADTVNRPRFTYQFFARAPRPKFLLKLLGAPHLPPYTSEQPQLGIVERVSIAFLDRYLKQGPRGLIRMRRAGDVSGVSTLISRP